MSSQDIVAAPENRGRLKALFHQAPVGISLKDYSGVKVEVDKILAGGIDDPRQYLVDNPEILPGLSGKIQISEANQMLADIYRAKSISAFMECENEIFKHREGKWREFFVGEISSFLAGEAKYTGVIVDTRMDGSYLEVLCISHLVEGCEEDWGEVITYFEDITHRRQNEAELARHRDDLAQLVREQSVEIMEKKECLELALEVEKENNELQWQFVTTVSHEFRTALAIIDGLARRLGKKWQNISFEEAMDNIATIRGSVSRMLEQIDNTLASSRVQKGMIDLEFDNCDLRAIVSGICNRQSTISEGIDISVNLSSLPDTIEVVPGAIEHIFSNLLSNAIKYSPKDGTVEITGIATDTDVFISVRDYGVGIPSSDMKNLFRRYFRASTAKGFQGTGIGLHLVRQLVELQNGTINVDSVEGRGSIFTVQLPRTQNSVTG